MKKNLLWQLLTLVLLVVPSLYLLYVWRELPAQVPTHFDSSGQANGYTGREHLWLLTLGLPLGAAVLLSALPYLDPKRRLDGANANFQKLRLALVALLSGLACYSLYLGVHPGTPPGQGLAVLLGVFFMFMGNYLTTVQPNYFVGIRTPWTLESPTVWARTHRIGGIMLCLAGVLLVLLAFVLPAAWVMPVLLVLIVGTSLFSYGYSYWLFREEQKVSGAI
ncbi:SdpI family protein [Hymenobacter convexus]|uniref:SdpI family protein n=1 Tax=Hymenobacter sp. CA1UV-4 TaxID=3063782 RepID=UPI002713A35E|nr:SdpI family protein [Hymenobacter sp. CA1UV-4]MDO7853614.1 SdpI family protein [Hymenobacter sp. CA1UV-4]